MEPLPYFVGPLRLRPLVRLAQLCSSRPSLGTRGCNSAWSLLLWTLLSISARCKWFVDYNKDQYEPIRYRGRHGGSCRCSPLLLCPEDECGLFFLFLQIYLKPYERNDAVFQRLILSSVLAPGMASRDLRGRYTQSPSIQNGHEVDWTLAPANIVQVDGCVGMWWRK